MLKIGTDFSGIGAPEQALKNLNINFETVFASEIDRFARKSYLAINKKPKKFFKDATKRKNSEVDSVNLYVAGFPCQSFSNNGLKNGFKDATKGTFFFNCASYISEKRPDVFILENVKGLTYHDNGRTFQTIIDTLTNGGGTFNSQTQIDYFDDGIGYHVFSKIVNSTEFNVPQNRERIFLVGFRKFKEYRFPKKEELTIFLKDVLQNDPGAEFELTSTRKNNILFENPAEPVKSVKIKSGLDCGFELAEEGDSINYQRAGSSTRRGRVGKKVSQCLDRICEIATIQDGKIRQLTPRECWRLQGFADEMFEKAEQVNSITQLYSQAGNTISIPVIQSIIKSIYL